MGDFIVDNQRYHRFTNDKSGNSANWPFDRKFHILLNLAVGGNWGGKKGVDEGAFVRPGQILEVSWVRVYKLPCPDDPERAGSSGSGEIGETPQATQRSSPY